MPDATEPPVEAARGRRTLRYAAVGALIGALLVVVAFVAAALTGGTHWSFVVPIAVFGGAAVGGSFAPLFSLARDDGDDAHEFLADAGADGRADTHTDGAQARDRERKVPPAMPK